MELCDLSTWLQCAESLIGAAQLRRMQTNFTKIRGVCVGELSEDNTISLRFTNLVFTHLNRDAASAINQGLQCSFSKRSTTDHKTDTRLGKHGARQPSVANNKICQEIRMVDTNMASRGIEVTIKCHLIPKVNATARCKHLFIACRNSEFSYRTAATVRNVCNLFRVVPEILTHRINAVMRVLPSAQQTNRDGDLFAQFGSHLLHPGIQTL